MQYTDTANSIVLHCSCSSSFVLTHVLLCCRYYGKYDNSKYYKSEDKYGKYDDKYGYDK